MNAPQILLWSIMVLALGACALSTLAFRLGMLYRQSVISGTTETVEGVNASWGDTREIEVPCEGGVAKFTVTSRAAGVGGNGGSLPIFPPEPGTRQTVEEWKP